MRLRFTYLLLLCTLFLAGYGSVMPASGHPGSSRFGNRAVLSTVSSPIALEQTSLFSDDDDNDDINREKKKFSDSRNLTAAFICLLQQYSGIIKNNPGSSSRLCHTSSPKYIFQRNIRV